MFKYSISSLQPTRRFWLISNPPPCTKMKSDPPPFLYTKRLRMMSSIDPSWSDQFFWFWLSVGQTFGFGPKIYFKNNHYCCINMLYASKDFFQKSFFCISRRTGWNPEEIFRPEILLTAFLVPNHQKINCTENLYHYGAFVMRKEQALKDSHTTVSFSHSAFFRENRWHSLLIFDFWFT